jgi:hypothetical protein
MRRVFSNGPSKDFVVNPFTELVTGSSRIYVAAPYVTKTEDLLVEAKKGKRVDLLVGLNATTRPEALWAVHEEPNIEVRYYTHLFHGKLYLFDNAALVGSSNLTDGGLRFNREATIRLDEPDDVEIIEELRTLFAELWDPAPLLTTERLKSFTVAYERFKPTGNPDGLIGDAVGRAEPPSIKVVNRKNKAKRIYLEKLRRQVSEYRAAFNEVQRLLEGNQLQRAELRGIGAANEINLFLNWIRLTYAPGDESWKEAPLSSEDVRRSAILHLGLEWTKTDRARIAKEYFDWLQRVRIVFGSGDSVDTASHQELTNAILAIHAFHDQNRFTKGGVANLPTLFWNENDNDITAVKRALKYLVYGGGEFVERLHDVLYDPTLKVKSFGLSSALELYGTVKPNDYPPVNGRIAKALRYLGFNVSGGMS